eukprot:snap_masked-scaffold_2-processed-gene-14.14-mRNA-1 protein AED:0.30 eAED:0.31 QI:0/0/0/0.33/1/1/3/0/342
MGIWILGLSAPKLVEGLENIRQISCGIYHTLCSTVSTVYSFGRNSYGQLGHGNFQYYDIPAEIKNFEGKHIDSVVAGLNTSFVLLTDGKLFSFGYGESGEIGNGSYENSSKPVQVVFEQDVSIKQISARFNHVGAVSKIGELFMWGCNKKHQLGMDIEEKENSFPVKVDLPPIQEVCCGYNTSFVITKDKKVMAFGNNKNGRLGLESSEEIIEKPTVLNNRWGKECNLRLYGFHSHTFLLAKSEANTEQEKQSPITKNNIFAEFLVSDTFEINDISISENVETGSLLYLLNLEKKLGYIMKRFEAEIVKKFPKLLESEDIKKIESDRLVELMKKYLKSDKKN